MGWRRGPWRLYRNVYRYEKVYRVWEVVDMITWNRLLKKRELSSKKLNSAQIERGKIRIESLNLQLYHRINRLCCYVMSHYILSPVPTPHWTSRVQYLINHRHTHRPPSAIPIPIVASINPSRTQRLIASAAPISVRARLRRLVVQIQVCGWIHHRFLVFVFGPAEEV